MVTCNNCGATLEEGNKFCAKCGTPISDSEPQDTVCSNCGATIEKGNMFCAKCGTQVSDTAKREIVPSEQYQEDVGFKQKYLRWDNRLNRKRYIMRVLGLMGYGMVAPLILGLLTLATGVIHFLILAAIIGIAFSLLGIPLAIRRMHDLDRPGKQLLWCLLGLPNLYFGFLILFEQGTRGPNKYGPDPLQS